MVVGETPKRYRCISAVEVRLPRKGVVPAGNEFLVPKRSIVFEKPTAPVDKPSQG